MQQRRSITVLDANAFISMSNILNLGATTRLITTSDVLLELRDLKTKEYVENLPFSIQTIDCDESALALVKDFAKKTGDVASLSQVDLELLAITFMLYKREGLQAGLRKEPPPLQQKDDLNDIANPIYLSSDEKSQSSEQDTKPLPVQKPESTKQLQQQLQQVAVTQKAEQLVEVKEEEQWISVPVKKRKESSSSESESDGEQGWITTKNYEKKMAQANSAFKEQPEEQKNAFSISLVSADFAIQNVAIQMGMRLLSLDGRRIHSIRRFIYECYLCWRQFRIVDEKVRLCTNCGYNSLSKIAYSIDEEGRMVLHRKRGWKPNQKILEVKERKLEEQERNKKHQHARKKKKASIFEN